MLFVPEDETPTELIVSEVAMQLILRLDYSFSGVNDLDPITRELILGDPDQGQHIVLEGFWFFEFETPRWINTELTALAGDLYSIITLIPEIQRVSELKVANSNLIVRELANLGSSAVNLTLGVSFCQQREKPEYSIFPGATVTWSPPPPPPPPPVTTGPPGPGSLDPTQTGDPGVPVSSENE